MSASSLPIYFVDAFTTNRNAPFTGNPAAVLFLNFDDDISDDIKQQISNEANLSNTAFVSFGWKNDEKLQPKSAEPNAAPIIRRTIRWLTPVREVPLCGHATVATTKVLVEAVLFANDPSLRLKDEVIIEFESRFRGTLGAVYDCRSGRITLNFPVNLSYPLYTDGEAWAERLIEATVFPELTADSIQDIQYSSSAKIMILRLGDHLNENDIRRISPDFGKLKSIPNCEDMFGVIVTVKGKNGDVENERPHFYSRFFAPWVGVNEDPVCGAAHTVLTPYWVKDYFNGMVKFGETLLARQHSARGGNLYCTLLENDRVSIGGEARIVIKGDLKYEN